MTLSRLPLGYCTNVHPAQTVAGVVEGLDRFTVPVQRRVGRPVAAGLWLARPVVDEILATPDGITRLAAELQRRGLTTYTLNAFPYGDFHAARVKEQVYRPDWTTPEREAYTLQCAAILAGLLPAGEDGSVSTLPIGFKGFNPPPDFTAAAERLTAVAVGLARLKDETGRAVRIAIEPEPFCLLETTDEAVAFFDKLWQTAAHRGAETAVREYIGLCYDVCHQAVLFEDQATSVRALDRTGIRINKVQVSCAIHLERPGENSAGRDALRRYVEPRYLHQTYAKLEDGRVVKAVDLTEGVLANPGAEFLAADAWRVHFHVPVNADRLGPLATTRPDVKAALDAIAGLSYAPHLEVETYTWEVMPGDGPPDVVAGLTAEIEATQRILTPA
ncbi:metabolite traffic protein EboE [Limnoglobus roseus]|uniref:Sugar phosphate isomerase/epimerase n=1 Tax=Limnoglobus roseus TaxID=2598579 RepID=A0A5C1AA24_9BACT|nr:metabolite traffic protein EboE [Limnoglobus roseus]QEL15023.1 sugar phosphate isomerase/epimerase [Limnoglobus roseus]